jgi:phosphoribosyl 1,2-cyclic phosphodiesterase
MIAIALQSGSNGNCVYVEADGARLLFDAGISGQQAERRLAAFGRDIRSVDAVIISHDHRDHVRCAGVYQRKFGLPLWVSEATLDAATRRRPLGRLAAVWHFRPGESIAFGDAAVHTLPTPHDGADGAAFVVETAGTRLGVLTDLGHVFDGLRGLMADLDGVLIESNYDPTLLAEGPYPAHLKERIRGPGGHLSNVEAAGLLRDHAGPRLRWACLSHLSEANNTPGVALSTHREALNGALPLQAASRTEPVQLPEL